MCSVVADRDISERMARFEEADAIALHRQKPYLVAGRLALAATMIGTVVGAVVLLPVEHLIEGWPRSVIEGVQAVALVLAFIASSISTSAHPWMLARADAEAARADVFRAIMRAGASSKDLLLPALACFRDAHLDWQLGYLRKRSSENKQMQGQIVRYQWFAYGLRGLVAIIAALVIASMLAKLGWLWPQLRIPAEWINQPGRWQLGLGVIATGILSFTTGRSFMDRHRENAERYSLTAKEVGTIRDERLSLAEADAKAGHVPQVLEFCEAVQSALSAEHLAWLAGRGPVRAS